MRGLTVAAKEQSRIQVLNGVLEGEVTVVEAARLMGVRERHAWRLLAMYRKERAAAVAHGNRGRKPSTTTCPRTKQRVMALAKGRHNPQARHGPYYSLTRAEKGKTRSRYLKAEQVPLARQQVEAGREFRANVKTYWQACEQWADAQLEGAKTASQEAAQKGA